MDAPWALNRAIDAEVYRVKDRLILLFATRDPEGKVQMLGMAHAPYRSDYGPDKWVLDSTDGPLLKPDFEWEGHCIEAPTVLKYKGVWYMFYAGAYNHERQQIGLATSGDGLHFTRIPPEGLLFPAGEEGATFNPFRWDDEANAWVQAEDEDPIEMTYRGRTMGREVVDGYFTEVALWR